MRIAVIADIHGNAVALDAVLDDIAHANVEHIVCLGDAIQGGAQPAETMQRLQEIQCPILMGNADAWLLDGKDDEDDPTPPHILQKMLAIREWTLSQLDQNALDWIASFPATIELPLEGDLSLLCFHGSPTSFNDFLLPTTPEDEFQRHLAPYTPRLLTGGHTHLQFIRRVYGSDSFFFNPGSVGRVFRSRGSDAPVHYDPWAEYAILTVDSGRISLDLRRIPYDHAVLAERSRASGHPYVEELIVQ
jgi:predicted phosphodiesterase